jgi:hypothetical protein
MRSRSVLTAPPASQALAAGSPRVPALRRGAPRGARLLPYGVRAMWSERSRHLRGGAVLGSSGKVAGLAVRFLARDMRLTGAKAAGVPAA